MAKGEDSKLLGLAEISRVLRVSHNTVKRWVAEGCPTVANDGVAAYDVAAVFHWVVGQAAAKAGGINPVEARARKDTANAALNELKLRQLSGELVTRDQAESDFREVVGRVVVQLDAVPNKAAPLLEQCATGPERAALVRRLIREAIAEADRLARKKGDNAGT